ncbi:type VII secretion-associated protein [Gordonia oryzae]|uniref:Type VII secretion-associated protein n=1 Tax=Gordonia oryzae TaxID=2487349 RepID=A0A3N4GQP0_9ACTN|nr:type VII secretion-associated protein [Gordonia oryzae]RPA65253.1 type VII secretion-associated protein [Gordonia oryzae]
MTDTAATDRGLPRAATTTSTRPLVIDLAYGHTRVGAVDGPDLTDLLEDIDADVIVAGGVRIGTEQRWREVFMQMIGGYRGPVLVGHPSTWGAVRRGVLAGAAGSLRPDITLVPRAILVARSHADVTVSRCAVVETTHRPTHHRAPAPPRWDVQRLRRGAVGWEAEESAVLCPAGSTDAVAAAVEEAIDDGVEAVYVDGDDPAEVDQAVDLILDHAVAGRVVSVDHRLIARWGSRVAHIEPLDFGDLDAQVAASSGRRGVELTRWRVLGGVLAVVVLIVGVVAAVALIRPDRSPAPADHLVTQGRTSLLIPTDWQQTEQSAPSGATSSSVQLRVVFVAPDDGSRILLIQSTVRAGSTPSSVALSLRNRIAQRGDDVVSEFSASTRFAGRDVISYREAPASGAPIRWYVLVEQNLQVSVGCQAGTGGDSVDEPCAQAVASARIAPG